MGLLPYLAAEALRVRTEAGLLQIEVSHELGQGYSSRISRFEKGRVWPTDPDRVIDAYARACAVDPAQIWNAAADAMLEDTER